MIVRVVSWSNNKIAGSVKADFVLEQDSWNDYSFYTYYHLHVNVNVDNNEYDLVGGVRILKKNQEEFQSELIKVGIVKNLDNYCSLGTSLDYYERLGNLDNDNKFGILDFLNDITYKPSLIDEYESERGFNISLLRGTSLKDDRFKLAPFIITNTYSEIPSSENLKFTFKSKDIKSLSFDFSAKKYSYDYSEESLPNRICVIVGRNGSGKSTLLSKIARLVFSSVDDRLYIKTIGKIEPSGLGFPRVINISYSAFDSFQLPGVTIGEKKQILKDIEDNTGRYIYCGIRDIHKEVEEELISVKTEKGKITLEYLLKDKLESNYLKPLTALRDEFYISLKKLLNDETKIVLLKQALDLLTQEPSFNFLNTDIIADIENKDFFNQLSTGHKFVIHSIVKLIYHTETRSLVLFDEPESHLHPPLLAILMKVFRMVLEAQHSFMIITTHSPIVVQETLEKHVTILRREGNLFKASPPTVQTYGENLSTITSDVFGLSTYYNDFHNELDKITDGYFGSEEKFERYISGLFDNKISSQAYAYLMSRFYNNPDK